MKKRLFVLVLLLLMIFPLSSCTGNKTKYSATKYGFFDTVLTLTGYTGAEKEFDSASELVFGVLEQYHRLTDIYYEYENVVNCKTINDNAGKTAVVISDELFAYLSFAKEMAEKTNGACDLMLGAVTKLWKFASEQTNLGNPILPSEEEITEALTHCGYALLELDETNKTAYITDENASLDLGATAKGYAVEMATQALKNAGYDGFLIDAGGNIRTLGEKPNGKFLVGVKNPNGGSAINISLKDSALVTSGTYNQTFTVEGKEYSHIIDGKTGYPADTLTSISIKCESSAIADALSTALFIVSEQERAEILTQFSNVEYFGINKDGSTFQSEGFAK